MSTKLTGSSPIASFNRTLVELKYLKRSIAFFSSSGFNRTLVELKLNISLFVEYEV